MFALNKKVFISFGCLNIHAAITVPTSSKVLDLKLVSCEPLTCFQFEREP